MRILELINSAAATLLAIDDGSVFLPRVNPAQITGDQNNYAIGAGTVFRMDTDAARSITGIDPTVNGLLTGRLIMLIQTAAFNLTLVHQSASSTSGNRIIGPSAANVVLAQNEAAILWFDLTTNRWRAFKL